jgi:hypothetical protein
LPKGSGLLTGNPNKYPFDSYVADIDLLVTAPAKKKVQPAPRPGWKVLDEWCLHVIRSRIEP